MKYACVDESFYLLIGLGVLVVEMIDRLCDVVSLDTGLWRRLQMIGLEFTQEATVNRASTKHAT